jgi:hypothetical protein
MARPWVGRIEVPCGRCGKPRVFNDTPAGRRRANSLCLTCSTQTCHKSPALERFERRFIPEPMSGCWLWTGAMVRGTGYGSFRVVQSGVVMGAHRAAWTLYRGQIPAGMQVCHRCDNRLCVNPDHLFVGTAFDNMADAARKGRMKWKTDASMRNLKRGEDHHSTPLTDDDVRAIRSSELSGVELARRYGITPTSLSRIRRGLVWRHI